MFEGKSILIVEDDTFIALDLTLVIEEQGGAVIGPLPTVRRTLEILDTYPVDGAILDVRLSDRDVTPVAERLLEAGIPFVLHTATGRPETLGARADVPVIMKPAPPLEVLKRLRSEIDRIGGQAGGPMPQRPLPPTSS